MGRFFLPALGARLRARGGFDAAAEQARLAEVVVRSAASLVASEADPQALIERKCQLLTAKAPHIVLAWTWFGPPQADSLRPQAVAGAASAYARALVIERTPLTAIGPAFRTLAGRRLEPFNVSAASLYGPWRRAAREHGVKSVLALPLQSWHDDQRGLFVLYSDVEGYFDQVGVGLFEALAQLFSAVLSRAARHAELQRAVWRDALTGLHNRQALPLLAGSLQRATEHDPPAAVLVIDVDHFKRVNDVHGHATGDEALRHVAQQLQAVLRSIDVVMRWGGEEFVVGLAGTPLVLALGVAEKLRERIAGHPLVLDATALAMATPGAQGGAPAVAGAAGAALAMTVSVGVSAVAAGEPLAAAIGRADAALYRAKHAGRNRVEAALPP